MIQAVFTDPPSHTLSSSISVNQLTSWFRLKTLGAAEMERRSVNSRSGIGVVVLPWTVVVRSHMGSKSHLILDNKPIITYATRSLRIRSADSRTCIIVFEVKPRRSAKHCLR